MKTDDLRTEEVVAMFKNGEQRYNSSALFNRVVQMLARDVDPYDVIDSLITVTEDTIEAFKQYISKNPPSINLQDR